MIGGKVCTKSSHVATMLVTVLVTDNEFGVNEVNRETAENEDKEKVIIVE